MMELIIDQVSDNSIWHLKEKKKIKCYTWSCIECVLVGGEKKTIFMGISNTYQEKRQVKTDVGFFRILRFEKKKQLQPFSVVGQSTSFFFFIQFFKGQERWV